jgi:hypothetical protein
LIPSLFQGRSPKSSKFDEIDYGGKDLAYRTNVMGLFIEGADTKKLCDEGHITLDEVFTIWNLRKQNGYMSNNLDLDVKVKA